MLKQLISPAMAILTCAGSAVYLSSATAETGKSGHHLESGKQFIGLFQGATRRDHNTEYSYGLEYEYLFTSNWGGGLVYERTNDGHHEEDDVDVMVISAYYHFQDSWRFGLGAGRESIKSAHSEDEDLIRLGISYDFHFKGFGIAPTWNVDRVDGKNSQVVGVALTKSF